MFVNISKVKKNMLLSVFRLKEMDTISGIVALSRLIYFPYEKGKSLFFLQPVWLQIETHSSRLDTLGIFSTIVS